VSTVPGRPVAPLTKERVHQRAQRRKRGACVVERRFKRYDQLAGLAFWLYLTRGWVEDGLPAKYNT